ncbi:MAG: metal-dependent transcriptional regulator [Halobacteria archaeon]|nr:metal-dependent transcriptional regulator [Halobacteria archaeon]
MSESIEMYLKEIYLLSRDGSPAKTGKIAERLGISPPSVTEMLGNLENDDLIEYKKYKGASLTPKGEERARNILQKHCLVERFLVKFLGVREGFHDEACRIEHVMSDNVATELEALVEQEDQCPDCYDPQDQHCALLFAD